MRIASACVATVVIAIAAAGITPPNSSEPVQPLPAPVTNNAVAVVKVSGEELVYSLMGLGPEKDWKAVTNASYALNVKYNKWTTVRSVPGSGRLGAVAVNAREQILLLGGFVPDNRGMQAIVSDFSIYDPVALRWYRGPDIPTPVRDAIAGVYRDRYVYLVGGFSPKGPTHEVQIYDAQAQRWLRATSFPGTAVFGHAGTVVNDAIIYVDGAEANPSGQTPRYAPSTECWLGRIDRHHPEKIQWKKLPSHPGSARYRIAAGGSDRDQKVYFAGGTDAIYDYSGIGLDGKPGEPSPVVFAYNLRTNAWEVIEENDSHATMDHRGLAVTSDGLIVVGGMGAGQKVLATAEMLPKHK
jgi:N-acetylneuraminic acid mutarotase